MVECYSSTYHRTHFSSKLLGKVVWLSRTRPCQMRCLISVCLWLLVCCVKRTMGDCFCRRLRYLHPSNIEEVDAFLVCLNGQTQAMLFERFADVFLNVFNRYKPMLLPTTRVCFDRWYEPTSSHVSARSKLPMVTSNNDFDSLLHHAVLSLKSRDFLALVMMKLSYSTMPNVSSIIASHNKHLLTIHAKPPDNSPTTRTCNCRIKESCPLNGRCLQESVVYQALSGRQDNKEQQRNIGQTEGPFKLRYNNHN